MRRAKKVLAVLAGLTLLVVVAPWVWIRWMESRRWAHLERRVEELAKEIESRSGPRPPLRGTPLPGDAWDDYLEAFKGVEGEFPGWYDPRSLLDRTVQMDELFAQYGRFLPALELLQRGTRREKIRRVRLHDEGYDLEHNPAFWAARKLALVARTRARHLCALARPSDTAELLLDLCRFGHDLMRDGSGQTTSIGRTIAQQALTDLEDLILANSTTTGLQTQIDRELQIVDASLPTRAAGLLGELEQFGRGLLHNGWEDQFEEPPSPGWRDWRIGWSRRLQMTAAFDEADRIVALTKDVDAMTAADERLLRKDLTFEYLEDSNLYKRVFNYLTYDGWPLQREHRTRLLLLRTAAHYRATGEILELDDPFGTKLFHRLKPDVLRVWGVGKDGKDLFVEVPRR